VAAAECGPRKSLSIHIKLVIGLLLLPFLLGMAFPLCYLFVQLVGKTTQIFFADFTTKKMKLDKLLDQMQQQLAQKNATADCKETNKLASANADGKEANSAVWFYEFLVQINQSK
jgi:hypothetical protein